MDLENQMAQISMRETRIPTAFMTRRLRNLNIIVKIYVNFVNEKLGGHKKSLRKTNKPYRKDQKCGAKSGHDIFSWHRCLRKTYPSAFVVLISFRFLQCSYMKLYTIFY